MNRLLLLALLVCAACKHSSSASSSSHAETSTVTDTTSSETGAVTTTTTQTEGPGKTTTTVEDYGPPEEVMPSVPDERGGESSPSGALPATQGAVSRSSHGPLVRRTVTVTERGAETTETHQQATTQGTAATETRAAAKVDAKAQEAEKSAPALSCAFGGWLAIAGVVAALFGLGYFAIKRLRSPV